MDEIFLNNCAVLLVILLPATGKTDQKFLDNFMIDKTPYLERSCMYLVFDRHNDESVTDYS